MVIDDDDDNDEFWKMSQDTADTVTWHVPLLFRVYR